ncbi:RNA-binding protein 4.1-like isoform X3 [Daphnia pulicaria]|uniref:RNA-binding protein 4.1-like isoform X3 n=1 Tax=Daphnia pulicaria TaxID=35523 RepID=UPI001EEB8F54|nr:RNA-binding protein 4.1-like isoform X3 [Daphnia pulicaria]XP_046634088.1 RNA-binding protein 4.1-like isoform X3 [Daphnia pulicaria]
MAAPPTKIFVGRLPLDAKQEDLRALFEKYGVITECDVLNRFGFVHMKSEEMAKRAIAALHNSEFMGSRITVEPSTGKKGAGGGGGGGGGGGRGGRSPGGGRGGGPVGRNGGFGGGRPSPYDRPRGLGDRYGPPGYYEDFDMYGRRGPAPVSRDPYGPPSYERRGYEPAYGDRYGGGDRDRRPMPPMGGSPYDRRPPPSADYPPSRAGPEYRRRTPPPGPMGDTYGRFDRDVYEAVPSDPYGSRRYPGAAPLGDRDLPPRRY